MKKMGMVSALVIVLFLSMLTGFGAFYSRRAKAVPPPKPAAAQQVQPAFEDSMREDRELLKSLLDMEEADSLDDLDSFGGDAAAPDGGTEGTE